jgi:3-phytase
MAGMLRVGVEEAEGLCMYHSRVSGNYYVFVSGEEEQIEQWQLFDNGQGLIDGRLVRSLRIASEVEGCVADDELGWLYMAEEEQGIWKFRAEPGDNTSPVLVDSTGAGGHLRADVEGLTLYYASDGQGYLMASSQGSNEFVVYRREGNNEFVTSFQVVSGNSTDAVSDTSGIDVTNLALGPGFPQGLFVTQDDENEGDRENYKLVAWSGIASQIQPALTVDTIWSPRTTNPGQPIAMPASPSLFQPTPAPVIQPTPPLSPISGTMPLLSVQVAAVVETDPVSNVDDAADDPAIWVHPTDPAQSTIIGTDKDGGLVVYELSGRQLQYLPDGLMNNVDLRYNFPLGGQRVTLVTAGNRKDQSIAIYRVNPQTRQLENVAARTIRVGIKEAYGSCMYHSSQTDKYYFIVNDDRGQVEQWELYDNGAGRVDARSVRTFTIGTQTEGCVADDELAQLYIGEEEKGIWKYGAEPWDASEGRLIDTTSGGHLTADVEGLTLYYGSNGTGYLIASSQGSDAFVIYRREGNNDYIATFQIGAGNGVDEVSETDGIDVTNLPLGPFFPQGVFVAQDDSNDGGNQNYKLASWPAIATAVSPILVIDTTWDPR